MARKLVWIAFWFVVVWLLGGKEIAAKIWLKYFPVEESHYFEKAEKYCFNQTCLEQIEGKWWVDDGKTKIPADEKLSEEYQNKIEGMSLGEVAVTNKENFGPLGIGDGEEVWLSVNGKKLEIGKITSSYDGTWVRPEGEEVVYRPEVVIDNGQLAESEYWRQKYLYQLPRYQIKQITRTVAGREMKATAVDGKWKNENLIDVVSNLAVEKYVGSCPSPLSPEGEYVVESESGEKYQFGYGQSVKLNKSLVWMDKNNCFEIDRKNLGLLTGTL